MERASHLPRSGALAIFAVALTIILAISGLGARKALALDTGSATGTTGSIIVHKYKTTVPSDVPGTGAEGQGATGDPVRGTEFTLYALDIAKVESGVGVVGGSYAGKPLAKAPAANDVDAVVASYGDPSSFGNAGKTTGITGASGTVTFSNLPFGYYLLTESKPVEGMSAIVPSVITLPYASEATDGKVTYLTEVHIYPKNVTTDLVSKREMSGKEYVEVGDTLSYRITFGLPVADRIFESDSAHMKATITDLLPTDAAGEPVLDYLANSAKVSAVLRSGKLIDLGTLAENKLAVTEPSSTEKGKLVWDYSSSSALAKAISSVNKANVGNWATDVVIDFKTTANSRAVAPAEAEAGHTPAVNNKVEVTIADDTGTDTISGDAGKAESGNLYSAGFGFYKVAAAPAAPTPAPATTYLSGAEFTINALDPGTTYSTEEGNLHGVLVKQGSASAARENWLTSTSTGGKGFVSFGSLTGYKQGDTQERFQYWDGSKLAPYTQMSDAVKQALSTGQPQQVSLWLVETKAPEGYQKLAKAIKVTVTVSKPSATEDLTFSVAEADGASIGADGFTVENARYGEGGFALPNTGGTGALLIVLAGVASISTAIILSRRRRDEK